MFIAREKLSNTGSFATLEALRKQVADTREDVDNEFEEELHKAVEFCNDDRCKEIKEYLSEYCSQANEQPRYQPFVIALNRILRSVAEQPEVIFVVNDPCVVGLYKSVSAAKRKPDIILVKLEVFKSWFEGCQDFDFEDCQTLIASGKGQVHKDAKPSWSDVLQFWELKRGKKLNAQGLSETFSVNDMNLFASNQAQEPSFTTSASAGISVNPRGVKRKFEGNSLLPKSSRSQPQTASSAQAPHSPLQNPCPTITPEVQCAYYAIERLRSSWKVAHASGILLTGTALNVLWYDAQGCLKSRPLDIVKSLPLLVILITVQYRSKHLSGFRNIDLPEPYGSYVFGEYTGLYFQLTGRRTCSAVLTPRAPNAVHKRRETSGSRQNSDGDNQDDKPSGTSEYFFKVSWPEDSRQKERAIVEEARRRAKEHLSKEGYVDYVLNHLPDIRDSGVVPDTCTAIVRVLTNCPTDGSRSQYWIISKRLKSLESVVPKFDKFKKIYLELIRCHRLLWTIGIAHGDISFNNLMYDDETTGEPRGILNDFDLASIMNPGDSTPSQTGFRRTGTKIFMAFRLLQEDALNGEVYRLYRHELESFGWVLLYAFTCVDDKGKILESEPMLSWIDADHSTVRKDKAEFLWTYSTYLRSLPKPFASDHVLFKTLDVLFKEQVRERDRSRNRAQEAASDFTAEESTTDQELLRDVVLAWGANEENCQWIQFKAQQPPTDGT